MGITSKNSRSVSLLLARWTFPSIVFFLAFAALIQTLTLLGNGDVVAETINVAKEGSGDYIHNQEAIDNVTSLILIALAAIVTIIIISRWYYLNTLEIEMTKHLEKYRLVEMEKRVEAQKVSLDDHTRWRPQK